MKNFIIYIMKGARTAVAKVAASLRKLVHATKGIVLIIEIGSLTTAAMHLAHANVTIQFGA